MFKPAFYRVLFVINDGEELDIQSISRKLNVISSTARRYVRELVKKGYLRETRPGYYALTSEGKLFRNSLKNLLRKDVDEHLGYVITDPFTGNPVPIRVTNIQQLYAVVKYGLVPSDILAEHIRRGYLTKWVNDVLGDHDLANMLENNRDMSIDQLLAVLEERLKILDSIRSVLGV